MQKKSIKENAGTEQVSNFSQAIALLCGIFILATFISSFFPLARIWGINHLGYFPLWVRIVFTLAGLLILIPWVNSEVYKFLEQVLSFLHNIFAKGEVLGYLLFSLVSMFFFWLFRIKVYFLGDGYLYIFQLKAEQFSRIALEPLEIFFHLYLYKFLKLFSHPSSESVYVSLSILAGGVFVFILFFLAKSFSEDRFDRLFILVFLLFSGATQIFLGYIEHYTLTYVSAFAYLYFSLRYLQGKAKIFLPIIFCLLSVGFHFSTVYLLPSLLFLFIARKRKGELVFDLKRTILYFSILTLIVVLFFYYIWSMQRFLLDIFVPLFKGRPDVPDYTIFSLPHLLDMLNQHLLLSPTGLILFLSLVIVYRKKIRLKDPTIFFLTVIIITQFFYHLMVDPKFGAVRDWDLFSNVALGYILLGAYLFVNLVKCRRYPATVLIFIAVLSSLPFFLLNSSAEKGFFRFKNLMDIDVERSYGSRYQLFTYYIQQKEYKKAEEIRAEIYRVFPEDSLTRMAKIYMKQGRLDQAKNLLEKAIEKNPRHHQATNDLGMIFLKEGRIEEAIKLFKKVLQTDPFNPKVHVNLGLCYLQQGRMEQALIELRKSEQLGEISPEVYCDIALIYSKLGETEKAIKSYEKAIEAAPDYFYPYFGIGQIYLERNLLDKATTSFEEAVRLKSDYPPAHYSLGLTYARRGLNQKAIEEFEIFLEHSTDQVQDEKVKGWIQRLRSTAR